MEREPSRRSFIAAVGAAAALASAKATAAPDQVGPVYRTAGELVPALAGRQVSSRELVDSAIARIEALDPKINAVVVRDFDRARGAGPPQTPAIPAASTFAVIGPMARNAADLALELAVLAGPDELWDGIGYKLALPPPRHDQLADFRVLVIGEHPLCPTAASMSAALDGLADHLAKLGCTVLRTSSKMPDLASTTRNYVELLAAFFSADLLPDDRLRVEAAAQALSPDDLSIPAARLRGLTMTHAAWIKTGRVRTGLRARWQALFQDVDVVLCPPMPTAAFPHDHSPMRTRELDIDGKKVPYGNQLAWAGIATSNGLPATTMPIAHTDGGLPIGVQIIGGYLDDNTTIAFAGFVEREFGGFTPPPSL